MGIHEKNLCYYLSYYTMTILIIEMNVLKKHIIADQWSSHPWHGFSSWWSDESVCVCVPTYVPNIPKPTTSEDASTIEIQVDSILKKAAPKKYSPSAYP